MEEKDGSDLRKALLEIRRLMGADIVVTLLVGESSVEFIESIVRNLAVGEEDDEGYPKTTIPKIKLNKVMRYMG